MNLSSILGDIGDVSGSSVDKDKAIQSITTLSNFLNTLAGKDTGNSGAGTQDTSDGELPTGQTSTDSLGTSQPEEDPELKKAREEQAKKQRDKEKQQRTEVKSL